MGHLGGRRNSGIEQVEEIDWGRCDQMDTQYLRAGKQPGGSMKIRIKWVHLGYDLVREEPRV